MLTPATLLAIAVCTWSGVAWPSEYTASSTSWRCAVSRSPRARRTSASDGSGRYGDGDGRTAPTPRPGMSAVAHLAVRAARDAVAVPASAVFNSGGRDTVWVVRDGKAARVPVTVGVSGQDLVQVTAGVQAGEKIVVRGADQV